MHIQSRFAHITTPKGTVLVSHGYGEHSGRFTALTDALVEAGYDVFYYDHYGHGTAEGPRATVDVGRLIRDHVNARRIVRAHARTTDIFLFGHSMGGLITAASMLLDPTHLRGTVLTGPAFRPLPDIPASTVRKLLPLARLMPSLPATSTSIRDGESVLSRDPEVQKAFDADPLTWKGGTPLLTGATMILQGDEVLRRADQTTTPLLIFHGSADKLTDLKGSRTFVSNAIAAHPDADIHLRVVDGAYHEVLNEPEGPGIIRDIISWFKQH
ncbi:alpha/beta hydrolase [Schaalia vaccimaxillae]|uniref:alpha/beta hydrolase n=1 Tax=Schaalia vaccimaxillae TaxID=183916 RepID=UPI0003B56C1B|nr:alpha/beta hydrolase [Schaalia vaccimaxillae]